MSGNHVPDEGDVDPFHRRLHHVTPAGLIGDTAQTTGMRRREAISGKTVGASSLWMGQTHVPASTVSANHHHGESETAIYVVSGHPTFVFLDTEGGEPVETRVQAAPATTSSSRRGSPTARRTTTPTTRPWWSSPAPPRRRSWSTWTA